MVKRNLFYFFLVWVLIIGCDKIESIEELELSNIDATYAIPLINSNISIADLTESNTGNSSILVDDNNLVTVFYSGDLVRRSFIQIIPPFPFLADLPILDTIGTLELPLPDTSIIVEKATFSFTTIAFNFTSSVEEDIFITVRFPEVFKEGQVFEQQFEMKYEGTTPQILNTERISLDGWTIETETNQILVYYEAKLSDGTKIKFDEASVNIDILAFSFMQGFLGKQVYDLEGDIVPVGIFNKWKSGELLFRDPKVVLSVENSFGIPVGSKVNQLEIITIQDEVLQLESSFVDEGILFDFPRLDEIGEVKETQFTFDTTNSNIREIFNQRAKQVNYDIDAITNPENDPSIIGFATAESYYEVSVAVELPMVGQIDQLVLADTSGLNVDLSNDFSGAEFKLIAQNEFPFEIEIQGYFLDENGLLLDSLFETELMFLPAAAQNADGTTIAGDEITRFIEYKGEEFSRITGAEKFSTYAKINSVNNSSQDIWIRDDYDIILRMGVILEYKK